MLSIHKVSISGADYYVHLAREDYYLNGGEPPGKWHGAGADDLGVKGEVVRAQFENLFQGFSPDGTKPLVQNAGQKRGHHERGPGWDLTFSAPKSVSVCWALATPDLRTAIEAAHEDAVRTALDVAEKFAGITRRGSGGKKWEKAKLCFAIFQHGTSRAMEPQLHSHAVWFNLGVRADGTTGALRSEDMFDFKMAIGAIYRCQLASTLQRQIHLPVEKTGTTFEIKGVSRELMDLFSTRRKEILEFCEKHGIYSAVAAEKAALATRDEKEHVARDLLFRQWEDISFKVGWTRSNIATLFDKTLAARDWGAEMEILTRDVEVALFKSTIKPTTPRLLQAVAQEAQDLGLTGRQALACAFSGLDYSDQKLTRGTQATNDGFATELSNAQSKTRGVKESIGEQNQNVRAERLKQVWAEAVAKHKESAEAAKKRIAKLRPQAPKKRRKIISSIARHRARKKFAVLKISQKPSRFGPSSWGIDLWLVGIELTSKRPFKDSPKWNPLHDLKVPAFAVHNQMQPVKAVRRISIPLKQTTHAAADQIKGAVRASFKLGARIVLMNDQRVKNWGQHLDEGLKLARQLRAPQTLVAKTDRQLWRGLLEDWEKGGLVRPDKNLMITASQAKADRLNKAAQESRLKEGRLGKQSLDVHGVGIHLNDRVILNRVETFSEVMLRGRGLLKVRNLAKSGDTGTVTDIRSDGFSLRLDSGVTVEYARQKFPGISLAYAVTHEHATRMKPKKAFILFEGKDVKKEYLGITAAAETSKVRSYVTEENSKHFTVEGVRDIKRSMGVEAMERHEQALKSAEAKEKEQALRDLETYTPKRYPDIDEVLPYAEGRGPSQKSDPSDYWFDEDGKDVLAEFHDPDVLKNDALTRRDDEADKKKEAEGDAKPGMPERQSGDDRTRQEELKKQQEELRRQQEEEERQQRTRHTHGHSY